MVSEYHICRNTGKGVISMGYPVWGDNDQKLGVINVGIDLMWFNDFAVEAELQPDSIADGLRPGWGHPGTLSGP